MGQSLKHIPFPTWTGTLVSVFFHIVQKILEAVYKLRSNIFECGFLITIDFEITQAASPVTPVSFRFRILVSFFNHLPIVFQKRSIFFELASERILSVLHFNEAFGFYSLSGCQCLSVLLTLQWSSGIDQIKFQILFLTFTISVDVEIQAHVTVCQLLFP